MKKTSEVSQIVGVSKRALQFYDDEGMIQAERSKNNYRLYDSEVLEALWEILIYKEMGLELREIKRLLAMSEEEKKEYLRAQIKEIEEKIGVLKGQMKFISLILIQGLPQMPPEGSGVTYTDRIAELKAECGYEK